jgi:hypothetical protein
MIAYSTLAIEGDRAIADMLDAERRLRATSESAVRELTQILVDAAVRLDGERLEKLRRADPGIPGKWTPADWKAFFAAVPARSGNGWASLLKIIPQCDTTEEIRLQKQIAELTAQIEILSAQVARTPQIVREPEATIIASGNAASTPAVSTPARTEYTPCLDDLIADVRSGMASWPTEWPSSAVRRVLDTGIAMKRYWLALYMIGRWGVCSMFEIDGIQGELAEISKGSGSLRRVQDNLIAANFIEGKKLELTGPKTSLKLARLTPDGEQLFKALFGVNPVESDWSRLDRLHEGARFPEHTLAVLIFAMHARKRGWSTHILPPVEGTNAVPDLAVKRGDQTWYVEVELSKKESPSKWNNQAGLNLGKVALCAATPEGRARLAGDCRLANLPGVATDLATLIKPKFETITAELPLWLEEW